jgi:hypothetical protein
VIPVDMIRSRTPPKDDRSPRTKTSEVIVDASEKGSAPLQMSEVNTYDADDWGNAEDGNIEPVELVQDIRPLNRWKTLLFLQGVLNKIVRYLEVASERLI